MEAKLLSLSEISRGIHPFGGNNFVWDFFLELQRGSSIWHHAAKLQGKVDLGCRLPGTAAEEPCGLLDHIKCL